MKNLEQLNASFAHLKQLEEQRTKLMNTLHMWHQVMLQGIESETVQGFGFSLEFVKKDRFDKEPWYGPWVSKNCTPLWYNYVRLKDGTKKPLNPFIEAPK